MLPSRLLRAKHATTYQPMIKFLGQRSKLEHEPHAPAPHPAAPQDVVDNFQSFLAKKQSTSAGPESPSSTPKGQSTSQSAQGQTPADNGSGDRKKSGNSSSGSSGSGLLEKSSKPADFENFWEAPSYLWTPKEMSEREIEAIMSGGATDIRSGP